MTDEAMDMQVKREMRPLWIGLITVLLLAPIMLWIAKAPTDHAMAMRALMFVSFLSLATTIRIALKQKGSLKVEG